ncbi:DUF2271 domain-containing protein [Vibrio cidicii]|uniref:DUF2271 domain-containing protein n=1 Tax=Vibrio cidicii TaxID=1763883 RepID=UPI0018C23E1E|nr:DUF2271 domain-containing protein [Vibrio cidicii]EJL6397396.1 DUF2271 domain-containing protein [Vibrio navarrensis]EJL6564733.1 DUF2271 domain-containing protein [Vibrio navarrensis]MBG0754354.1 hypothetical protein [Vibrio cidicii]
MKGLIKQSCALLLLAAFCSPLQAKSLGTLEIEFSLPKIEGGMYARPYVAVWIEDDQGQPVRTVALWQKDDTWLKDLRQWWRKVGRYDRELVDAITSATRPAGQYRLQWDGKDQQGNELAHGQYHFFAEVVREHGGRDVIRQPMNLSHAPVNYQLDATHETGQVRLSYQP